MRRFWQVALAVAWRSIHKIATTPQLLLPSIVFPMFGIGKTHRGASRATLPLSICVNVV